MCLRVPERHIGDAIPGLPGGILGQCEATSSLDPGTELVIAQAHERLMTGRTVVVIAHRLTSRPS